MSDLEARIKRLEEIEEIKKLKHRYCYSVDSFIVEDIVDTFADDAKADYGPLGQYNGKEEIRQFFAVTIPKVLPFFVHMVHNGSIEVTGDTASGTWYFEVPANHGEMNKAIWITGRYDEQYKKVNGQWKIADMKASFIYISSYEKGWFEERFAV